MQIVMANVWKTILPSMILPPFSGFLWFQAAIDARAPPTPWTFKTTRSVRMNAVASVIEF